MATYLLTWNPANWQWDDQEDAILELERAGTLASRWSCGSTRSILPGDRFYLLKQGTGTRGLIASGWVTRGSYEAAHWKSPKPHAPTAWYVDIDFEVISRDPIIPRERLDKEPFNRVHWNTQGSGITIDPTVARILEEEWGRLTGSHFEPLPDEIDDTTLPEGAARDVRVNAYERNARARKACIEHYGTTCVVCDTDLGQRYGEAAMGLIHVHHITPLAMIKKRYRVHPINDLRPVCPNCHAVIHRVEPPFTIDEVRGMLMRD